MEAAGEEPPPDAEFDGGFKVPGTIFNRLFDYQKTGRSICSVLLDAFAPSSHEAFLTCTAPGSVFS